MKLGLVVAAAGSLFLLSVSGVMAHDKRVLCGKLIFNDGVRVVPANESVDDPLALWDKFIPPYIFGNDLLNYLRATLGPESDSWQGKIIEIVAKPINPCTDSVGTLYDCLRSGGVKDKEALTAFYFIRGKRQEETCPSSSTVLKCSTGPEKRCELKQYPIR